MSTPQLLKATLKRAPFTIFSKRAPATLPVYNVDKDFCYFFFNDNMKFLSGASPNFLTANNNRNAKTDFPDDHEQYFKDDASVCQEYPFPKVKVITEPWITPAMVTIVETRKTVMIHEGQNYMLGCFGPHDDIELGITSFRATKLPPTLDDLLKHVPDTWYDKAFQQLPIATTLVDVGDDSSSTTVIAQNDLAAADSTMPWKSFLESIASLPDYDSFHFGTDTKRAWIWRPEPSLSSVIAITVREKHTAHPEQVAEALSTK